MARQDLGAELGMTRSAQQLGELEELVLLAVLRLGGDAYGASIRTELRARAGRSISIGTIYVTLMRAEEKGLVRSWMGEPSGTRGGKAKRHFELLPDGVAALEHTRRVRERMWAGLTAQGERHAR
jgi:DNA-binding PadR family transcriptional regulator